MKTVYVTVPSTVEEASLPVTASREVHFNFDPATASFEREGADLRILFEGNKSARLSDFFAVETGKELPSLVLMDGTEISAADFLLSLDANFDIETAAGPAQAVFSGGTNYTDYAGELMGGVDRLASLADETSVAPHAYETPQFTNAGATSAMDAGFSLASAPTVSGVTPPSFEDRIEESPIVGSENGTSGDSTLENTTPGNTAPENNTPENNGDNSNSSNGNTPDGNTPEGNTPGENQPEDNGSGNTESENNTPENNGENSNAPGGNPPEANQPEGSQPENSGPENGNTENSGQESGGSHNNGSQGGETGGSNDGGSNGGDAGQESSGGIARAVLMYAKDESNDRVLFQLLQKNGDAWEPVSITEGTDLAALFTVAETNNYLDTNSIRLEDNGMLSIAVNDSVLTTLGKKYSEAPLETSLSISMDGSSYDMQVMLYSYKGNHAYSSSDFAAPDGDLAYGEWITGKHGLGGSGQVITGDGDDFVYIDKAKGNESDGNSFMDLGNGDNTVIVNGNAFTGSSQLHTGDGNDSLFIHDTKDTWRFVTIDMGEGDNYMEVNGQIGGSATMGNGNDTVIINGNIVSNSTVSTGGGDDTFFLDGKLAGQVFLGEGDDLAVITSKTQLGWSNLLDGGNGLDTVNLDSYGDTIHLNALGVSTNVGLKGFETIDLGASGNGADHDNVLYVQGNLQDLQLDTLLNSELLQTGDETLRGLLTNDASAVLRINGGGNDNVILNDANWQDTSATVTYDGTEYRVYSYETNDWSSNRTDMLLIECGLA